MTMVEDTDKLANAKAQGQAQFDGLRRKPQEFDLSPLPLWSDAKKQQQLPLTQAEQKRCEYEMHRWLAEQK